MIFFLDYKMLPQLYCLPYQLFNAKINVMYVVQKGYNIWYHILCTWLSILLTKSNTLAKNYMNQTNLHVQMYEYIGIKNLTNESPNKYVYKNCMNIQIVFTLHNGVTPLQHTHERIFLHVI